MQPNEPILSYPFRFVGGEHHRYAFTTKDDVGYEIRFVPSAYMFEEHLDVYIDAFEMIILVADNPNGPRIPADPRTAPTIRAVFYDFFQNYERVVIFICDSADGRHEARARKFTNWYYTDIQARFFKFDARVVDGDGSILISIVLHSSHTHFDDVVSVIKTLHDKEK